MKSFILGLSLCFSLSALQAEEYEMKSLNCGLVLKGQGKSYSEIDLTVCAQTKKESEIRTYVINDVLGAGNELEVIDLAIGISDKSFESIRNAGLYLSDNSQLELLKLKAAASRVDAYYIVDNYMGGTGEVAYLVFHSDASDLVKVFAVTTYSE
jgi:hypothetical protein